MDENNASVPDPTRTSMGQWLSRRIRAAGRGVPGASGGRGRRHRRSYTQTSSPAPDSRDPQLAGSVMSSWLDDRGYQPQAAAGNVAAQWEHIAGADVAAHVAAEVIDTDQGRLLVLQADSTTWATQMTLLLPKLRDRVIDVVGPGVIDDITIVGPTQPATFRGRWRVKGRGVRDTYG